MQLVPKAYQDKKIKRMVFTGATIGSVSVTAPGTGLRIMPVSWRLTTRGSGSAAIFAGTAGSELIRVLYGTESNLGGYYWDDEGASNVALVAEVTGVPAANQFEVYYMVIRRGAGNSGTRQ